MQCQVLNKNVFNECISKICPLMCSVHGTKSSKVPDYLCHGHKLKICLLLGNKVYVALLQSLSSGNPIPFGFVSLPQTYIAIVFHPRQFISIVWFIRKVKVRHTMYPNKNVFISKRIHLSVSFYNLCGV